MKIHITSGFRLLELKFNLLVKLIQFRLHVSLRESVYRRGPVVKCVCADFFFYCISDLTHFLLLFFVI